jgi:carbon storage regulator
LTVQQTTRGGATGGRCARRDRSAPAGRPRSREALVLVLSRQRDETIMIGDEIEVTVVDIRGDKVRLGISAPKEISVHRKEVYDAIRRENRAAAQVKPEDLAGLGTVRGGSPAAASPGDGAAPASPASSS